jgi:S1-C subfamily serine protease
MFCFPFVRSRTLLRAVLLFSAVIAGGVGLPAAAQDGAAAQSADVNKGLVQVVVIKKDADTGKPSLVTGTGFLINDKGIVITNRHVIEDGIRIYANPDGQLMNIVEDTTQRPNAEVIWSSQSLDLAILQTTGLHNTASLTLTTAMPHPGDPVIAIGYPGAADRNVLSGSDIQSIATVTSGVFSRKFSESWNQGGRPLEIVQHSAAISWGNSGGPLLDGCRRVIGVNTQLSMGGRVFSKDASGSITEGQTAAEGIHYASWISEAIAVLRQRDIPISSVSADPCVGGVVVKTSSSATAIPTVSSADGPSHQPSPDNGPYGRFIKALGGATNAYILVGALAAAIVAALLFFTMRRPGAAKYVPAQSAPSAGVRGETRAIRGATVAIGSTIGAPIVELNDEAGPNVLRVLPADFALGPIIVGREPPVQRFTVNDGRDTVSRSHFSLEYLDGKVVVRDLNSRNGTYVDGVQLKASDSVELHSGQTLKTGQMTLKVRFG